MKSSRAFIFIGNGSIYENQRSIFDKKIKKKKVLIIICMIQNQITKIPAMFVRKTEEKSAKIEKQKKKLLIRERVGCS